MLRKFCRLVPMHRALPCWAVCILLMTGCGGSSYPTNSSDDLIDGQVDGLVDGTVGDPADSPADDLSTEVLSELQGEWRADYCFIDRDQSISESIVFSDSTMTRTLTHHTASADCTDRFTLSRVYVAEVEVSDESARATSGAARDIKITYTRGYIIASSESEARFRVQGTTLQDLMAAEGITDINDIPVDSFSDSQVIETSYRIDGDVLRWGDLSIYRDSRSQFTGTDDFPGVRYNRVDDGSGCLAIGEKDQTVSVLMIGNSLMNGVQDNLERLLSCGGYTPELATTNAGGRWLYEHNEDPITSNLIAQGYDLTLLQEQSRGITTHTPPYDIISSLKNKIEAAGSEMGFYQTWGYQNREVGLTDEILSGYEALAAEFDAPVAHIGRAWDYFYTSHNEMPPFSLYVDYAHATPHGRALVAYVLYAFLTGDTPVNLSSLSLAEQEALELQNAAWQTYQSNL